MRRATRRVEPVTDDNRSMEYGMLSKFGDTRLPGELFHVEGISAWCPKCFENKALRPEVASLGKYLAAQNVLYHSDAFLFFRRAWGSMGGSDVDFIDPDGSLGTVVSRSPYLREVLASPLTGSLKKVIPRASDGPWPVPGSRATIRPDSGSPVRAAMKMLRADRLAEAITWFRDAVELDEGNVSAHFGLGYALFHAARFGDAIEQYRRGLEMAPGNIEARLSLAAALHRAGMVADEMAELRYILRVEPACAEAAARLDRLTTGR